MSKKENSLTDNKVTDVPIQEGASAAGREDAPVSSQNGKAPADAEDAGSTTPQLDSKALEQLEAKAASADEHWEKLLRARAELDNYRKRAVRERQEAVQYANFGLMEKLLPALDSFDMAVAAADTQGDATLESLQTGIGMVHGQLRTALGEAGLEEIDAIHQPFDPQIHEAVSQLESADVPEGHVMQQLRKGYRLKDRLLRPAMVVVAKKPSE